MTIKFRKYSLGSLRVGLELYATRLLHRLLLSVHSWLHASHHLRLAHLLTHHLLTHHWLTQNWLLLHLGHHGLLEVLWLLLHLHSLSILSVWEV